MTADAKPGGGTGQRRIDGHLGMGGGSHDSDAVHPDLRTLAAHDPCLRLRVSAGFEEFLDGGALATLPARAEAAWAAPQFRTLVARGLAWAGGIEAGLLEAAA